jgi:alpha-beta hydrolase superfamily lysophospholipase
VIVVRPRRRVPRGAIVFLNAATRKGLAEEGVERLMALFGRAGFVAVAPELPGLADGEVTPATLEAAVIVALETADRCGGRVALAGASTGAGLAVLAAADRRLADRVSVVAAVAPFSDLRAVVRRATVERGEAPALLVDAVPRSLRALGSGDAVERVLANRDPAAFEALWAALPHEVLDSVEALAPVHRAGHVKAQLLLAAAPDDAFFPIEHQLALACACPRARLTLTRALEHVTPRRSLRVVSLLLFLVRFLRLAAQRERPGRFVLAASLGARAPYWGAAFGGPLPALIVRVAKQCA